MFLPISFTEVGPFHELNILIWITLKCNKKVFFVIVLTINGLGCYNATRKRVALYVYWFKL